MTGWTSRSIGTRLQHNVFYLLIALGGGKAAYALLFWVTLWYMGKKEAARRCAAYLEHRFPDAGRKDRWIHRWRLQQELGKVLVDRAVAGITGRLSVNTDGAEMEKIRQLHAEGSGLIMLSAHIGGWQVSMSVLPEALPVPVSVVLYRDAGDLDRHYFEHRKEAPPFSIIDPAGGPGSAIAMVQTLQKGGLLCMMGDRPFGDSQVCRTSFLGGVIGVPFTPYYLASVTGAPIVVFFSPRRGPGMVRNVIGRVIRVPAGLGKRPEAYEPYARMYAEAMEESVATYPYQFFNFFNMWEYNGHQGKAESRAG